MANPFLNDDKHYDIETAILLEKATVHDIGNAVAYTNERKEVFINTDDNLFRILPDYNEGMLKWLLWHEEYHCQLRHANRFFKYLYELSEEKTLEEFYVTKDEVNIIMDILVHDIMSTKFPELVETALTNLAQFRNRNSLGYTFKTFTLEEMLDEYKAHKKAPEEDKDEGKDDEKEHDDKDSSDTDKTEEGDGIGTEKKGDDGKGKERKGDRSGDSSKKKGHGEGGTGAKPSSKTKSRPESDEPEIGEDKAPSKTEGPDAGEHDKTDWSKLDKIDSKEFITNDETYDIQTAVKRLRQKKLKLAKLTETLNGLASSKKRRSYRMPSMIQVNDGVILKGRVPGMAKLYLIFDASGSMSAELDTFKKIISETVPQAMMCECEWFSGKDYDTPEETEKLNYKKTGEFAGRDYYKGKFKDIMNVKAASGYGDDGDRVIELCMLAEEKGYTPIGVTDGGGGIYCPRNLKKLKRTILIGTEKRWLDHAKEINPNIQVQDI